MGKMIIKIILLTIFIIVVGFFVSVPIFTNSETREKIKQLGVEQDTDNAIIDFTRSEFLSLPSIVQKYLKTSLNARSSSYQLTQLTLSGGTRTDPVSEWKTTEVDFYYSLSSPAFIWVATSEQFLYLWNKTINTYLNEVAKSESKFLSSITTDEIAGVKLDQSYFLFYLLNSVFSPAALLPSQNIQWKKVEKLKAEVVIWNKSARGKAVFSFNKLGAVEKVVVEDMFIPNQINNKRGKFTLHLANYKEIDGNKIPTYLEYQWNLPGGDFTSSRFNITDVVYN